MTKESLMTLRVDEDLKRRIADAARYVGKSITDFALEATMLSVQQVESSPARPRTRKGPKPTYGAFPAYFKIRCQTARTGGANGYEDAGYMLAHGLDSEDPYELTSQQWRDELAKLRDLINAEDTNKQILAWFQRHLPRCVAIVPPRRRTRFIDGVRRAFGEES